jgi:hypothetical protein
VTADGRQNEGGRSDSARLICIPLSSFCVTG